MHRLFGHIITTLILTLLTVVSIEDAKAQYAKGNSPYSRYGFGDLHSNMLLPNQSMSGGMAATYRNFWNINLVNPASLGQLRFTSFQVGLNYEHHELHEKSTGLYARADNGNLGYLSLAFPITKSWKIRRDTLRRGAPVQWGMGVSLMPYSTTTYDVTVLRDVGTIPNVEFNYTGNGTRYRVNWSNGVTYKGISAGANLGLLFGKLTNTTAIDFQDSSYSLAFDESNIIEENAVGFIWDFGVQYEYVLEDKQSSQVQSRNYDFSRKIVVGAYAGGVAPMRTRSNQTYIREGNYHPSDSVLVISDVEGTINMPLKIGGGVSYGAQAGFQVGLTYETQLWSMYRVNGQADPNVANTHRIAVGIQWVPDFVDYTNYFNRIHYRFGAHYSTDPRNILAENGSRYQLMNYGLSLGAGFPMRPPKSKGIVGFVNLGFDVGYLGHPQLIEDIYFQVNLGFTLNASGWFTRSKFR